MTLLQKIANKQNQGIEIEITDLKDFFDSAKDHGFVERVQKNTTRYINLFSSIIDANIPPASVDLKEEDFTTFDIVMQQRRFNATNASQAMRAQGLNTQNHGPGNSKMGIPPELERTYHLSIIPGNDAKKEFLKMREIKANAVGSLVSVKGIVTRCADVKPCIKVADYACDACGFEVYQVINTKMFTPLIECPSDRCVKNMVKG